MRTFTHLPDLSNGSRLVGRGCRALIVDDERDTVITLGILLRSEGFDVRMEMCAAGVPAAVEDFSPDFVLLDVGLPDRNGYDLAKDLRARYGDACPPLIAVTAYASRADKARAKQSGFDYHVGKPYNPAGLIHLLTILKRTN